MRENPQRERNEACSGDMLHICVEACSSGAESHAAVGHILHDERIDSRCYDLLRLHAGLFDLVVEKQRIERGVDTHTVLVGILNGTATSSSEFEAAYRAPNFVAPIYTASAPQSTASTAEA